VAWARWAGTRPGAAVRRRRPSYLPITMVPGGVQAIRGGGTSSLPRRRLMRRTPAAVMGVSRHGGPSVLDGVDLAALSTMRPDMRAG